MADPSATRGIFTSFRETVVAASTCSLVFLAFDGGVQYLTQRHFTHTRLPGLLDGGMLFVAVLVPAWVIVIAALIEVAKPTAGPRRRAGFHALIALLLAAPALVALYPSMRDHRIAVDLMRRGVRTDARLLRDSLPRCSSRRPCTAVVGYAFTPRGAARPITDFVRMDATAWQPEPAFTAATQTGVVPIRYDPASPTHAMLDWSDRIARSAATRPVIRRTAIVVGVLTVLWLLLVGLGERAHRRRRQWAELGFRPL